MSPLTNTFGYLLVSAYTTLMYLSTFIICLNVRLKKTLWQAIRDCTGECQCFELTIPFIFFGKQTLTARYFYTFPKDLIYIKIHVRTDSLLRNFENSKISPTEIRWRHYCMSYIVQCIGFTSKLLKKQPTSNSSNNNTVLVDIRQFNLSLW